MITLRKAGSLLCALFCAAMALFFAHNSFSAFAMAFGAGETIEAVLLCAAGALMGLMVLPPGYLASHIFIRLLRELALITHLITTIAAIMAITSSASAQTVLYGPARVIDGDTVEVNTESGPARVRLIDIDAPESDQPGGAEATAFLTRYIDGRNISCTVEGRGVYGRALAICVPELASGRLSSVSINRAMVRRGWASIYRRSYRFERYQSQAISDCNGIWANAGLGHCWRDVR